jgi:Uma2 family endonuclease
MMPRKTRATVEDLYQVPDHGKAEIVDGEIVHMAPTGFLPNRAAGAIYTSLRAYERRAEAGYALSDNAGFRVNLPRRESFSPDVAFYIGEPTGMKFLEGAPVFAVEVRSEHDYGPAAERALAEKRADYFAAGTLVVWDVDLLSDTPIKVYRAADPDRPTLYGRGDTAEAEPALPGWSMPVADLFA